MQGQYFGMPAFAIAFSGSGKFAVVRLWQIY
jgi:hypothetical protein